MSLELSYPHIEKPNGQPARLSRLPRIRVAQIAMDYVAHGWSAEEMRRQHPGLNTAEIHTALAYYFDHQDEIDGEIAQEWQQVEQACASTTRSPFYFRMKAQGKI